MAPGPGGRGPQGPSKLFRNLRSEDQVEDGFSKPVTRKPNSRIQRYISHPEIPNHFPEWTQCPEIPTSENLFETVDEEITNVIDGPWQSKLDYLRTQYLLLREDGLRPLRTALKFVQDAPLMTENKFLQNVGLYDHVQICGITMSSRGLGIKVRFCLGRVGKNIHWQQSKRLMTGSLVVLMSAENKDVCKVGVVAARPLLGLEKSPPEIDLFFFRSEDIDIDCSQEWIMIEERSSFFEAQRHTLLALQRLTAEKFPLSEHLIDVQRSVEPPSYLAQSPILNLNAIFPQATGTNFADTNVLEHWPVDPPTPLDHSQQMALKRMLTTSVAIVQGPPGTGKTFVSVQTIKAITENMKPGDPPVIIACQTNHALDQFLRHVAVFQPMFARLGSRSKDLDVVKHRTIYQLRLEQKMSNRKGIRELTESSKQMCELLKPLNTDEENDFLNLKTLQDYNILSEAQCDSLEKNAEDWVSHDDVEGQSTNPLKKWLGRQFKATKSRRGPALVDYEEDEDEMDYEDIREREAEIAMAGAGVEDDILEMLRGDYVEIGQKHTGTGASHSDIVVSELLKKTPDMRKIKTPLRGAVYCFLQKRLKSSITRRLRDLYPAYMNAVQQRRIANLEIAEMIAREQKVIGLTTTGLAKYRSLISALRPKIMLIEEAAETLEAPVVTACVESLEQLILVGDHKQLRPHCNVAELEKAPYHLNISLFERLVRNGVDFSLLDQQRRMVPEIRRLLSPIYGNVIMDHPNVLQRLPVPGMGRVSTWFFTHEYPDERDSESSSFNVKEVQMIGGLVQYLIYNGVSGKDITILTFYNGQRRKLLKILSENDFWRDKLRETRICTVDSYQGEENEIVILSLVRSNELGQIGFVGVDNRVCVAMSRAQRGLYMFGNGELLCNQSKIWLEIIRILRWGYNAQDPPGRRVGFTIPLQCERHLRKNWIKDEEDWARNVGGCELPCSTIMHCGHVCPELCHPWDHAEYPCRFRCERRVPSCGHQCLLSCGEPCYCMTCERQKENIEARKLWEASQAAWDVTPGTVRPFPGHAKSTASDRGIGFSEPQACSRQEMARSAVRMQKEGAAASERLLEDMDVEKSNVLFTSSGKDTATNAATELTPETDTRHLGSYTDPSGNARHRWTLNYKLATGSTTIDETLSRRMETASILDAPGETEEGQWSIQPLVPHKDGPRFHGKGKSRKASPPPAGGGWDVVPPTSRERHGSGSDLLVMDGGWEGLPSTKRTEEIGTSPDGIDKPRDGLKLEQNVCNHSESILDGTACGADGQKSTLKYPPKSHSLSTSATTPKSPRSRAQRLSTQRATQPPSILDINLEGNASQNSPPGSMRGQQEYNNSSNPPTPTSRHKKRRGLTKATNGINPKSNATVGDFSPHDAFDHSSKRQIRREGVTMQPSVSPGKLKIKPTWDKNMPWADSAVENSASWPNNLPLGSRGRHICGGSKRDRIQGGRQRDTEVKVTSGTGRWDDQQLRKEPQATSGAVGWGENFPMSTTSWDVDGSRDENPKKFVNEQQWDKDIRVGVSGWETSSAQQATSGPTGGWDTGQRAQVQSNRGWDDTAAEGAEEIEW